MHTEMKYRFLIHYTLSFIGGYLGLYAIVSRADLFGNAQTANLIGVVRDLTTLWESHLLRLWELPTPLPL